MPSRTETARGQTTSEKNRTAPTPFVSPAQQNVNEFRRLKALRDAGGLDYQGLRLLRSIRAQFDRQASQVTSPYTGRALGSDVPSPPPPEPVGPSQSALLSGQASMGPEPPRVFGGPERQATPLVSAYGSQERQAVGSTGEYRVVPVPSVAAYTGAGMEQERPPHNLPDYLLPTVPGHNPNLSQPQALPDVSPDPPVFQPISDADASAKDEAKGNVRDLRRFQDAQWAEQYNYPGGLNDPSGTTDYPEGDEPGGPGGGGGFPFPFPFGFGGGGFGGFGGGGGFGGFSGSLRRENQLFPDYGRSPLPTRLAPPSYSARQAQTFAGRGIHPFAGQRVPLAQTPRWNETLRAWVGF